MSKTDVDSVWVVSDVAPDGTYVVTIQCGDDVALTLNRDQAIAYAVTVVRAATIAVHDAAVFAQLTALLPKPELAASVIADLRRDRPPIDDRATAPFTFEPIISARTSEPVVALGVHNGQIGQWTPADTRAHAMHVLEALAAADLDAAYRRYLTGTIGLDDGRARAAVGDVGNHSQQLQDPR